MKNIPTQSVEPIKLISTATADILKSVITTETKQKSKRTGEIKVIETIDNADAIAFLSSNATESMTIIKNVFASVFDAMKEVSDKKEKQRQAFIKGEVKAIKTGSLKKKKKVNIEKILNGVKKEMLWIRNRAKECEDLMRDPYAQHLFKQYAKVPEPKKKVKTK
jgi:hypothetical protein